MRSIYSLFLRLKQDTASTEYALIVAIIALGIIAGFTLLGQDIGSVP